MFVQRAGDGAAVKLWSWLLFGAACWWGIGVGEARAAEHHRGVREILLNDDGGWCWFQDERAVVVGDQLVLGSVASGWKDPSRRGNVEVVGLDLRNGRVNRFPLHKNLELDDHDAPAFLELPKQRLLAVYARHGTDNRVLARQSRIPENVTAWEPERIHLPSESSRVTYANLHQAPGDGRRGRIYNFFRGLDNAYKPSWEFSEDEGSTWQTGGILIDVDSTVRHRPYAKYASLPGDDGRIHVVFSEGHPRDYDNSLYHAVLEKRWITRSDGKRIRELGSGPVLPQEATRLFMGDSNNVAWPQDVTVDPGGRLRVVYSVQKDSSGLPPGQGGRDHRYHWATWDGRRWSDQEIAFAGSRLYAGEDDYVGGICLHPDEPGTVFISANVDPVSGVPLPSGHYELFCGRKEKNGGTWAWEALTPGAALDQLRPLVPRWKRGRTALLWLRGTYRAYTDYQLEVVGRISGYGR